MLHLFIVASIAIASITCESSDGMKSIDELIPDIFQVPSTPKSTELPAGGVNIDDIIKDVFQIPSTDGTISPNPITPPITKPPQHTTPSNSHTSDSGHGNRHNTGNDNTNVHNNNGPPNPINEDPNEANVSH